MTRGHRADAVRKCIESASRAVADVRGNSEGLSYPDTLGAAIEDIADAVAYIAAEVFGEDYVIAEE